MDIGVFIPINNNGWMISAASPQYMPSFQLNKQVVLKAEKYGLEFALSMITPTSSVPPAPLIGPPMPDT